MSTDRALIAEYPELSRAVKQCAALREAYLPYFLDGKIVGDCVLAEDCAGAYVTGYVLADSVLVFAVKHTEEDAVLHWNLEPFTGAGAYEVAIYDEDNQPVSTMAGEAAGRLTLSGAVGEMFVLKFAAKR